MFERLSALMSAEPLLGIIFLGLCALTTLAIFKRLVALAVITSVVAIGLVSYGMLKGDPDFARRHAEQALEEAKEKLGE